MDGKSELDARLARLEAALEATAEALKAAEARPDLGPALAECEAALAGARSHVETLEADLAARDVALAEAQAKIDAAEVAQSEVVPQTETLRLRAAVDTLTETSAALRDGTDGASDQALQAEVEALKAARALDLAEMDAILAELAPLLSDKKETADA